MGIPNWASKAFSGVFHFTKRHRAGFAISVSVCLISLTLYTLLYVTHTHHPILEFLANIELKTLDMRFNLRGRRLPGPAVVIVAIDQKSQDVLGRWPFPRSYFARAVDYLHESQARVIAFDINFPSLTRTPPFRRCIKSGRSTTSSMNQGFQIAEFDARLKGLEASADNDKQFADSIQRFQNVVLGWFALPKEEAGSQDPKRVSDFVNYLSFQCLPPDYPPGVCQEVERAGGRQPFPRLADFALYAKNFGYFNVIPIPTERCGASPW
jgi:hypothetical protein